MINIGDKAIAKRSWEEKEVQLFSELSGDINPIHLDAEYAKKTIFKKQIVHGFLVGSLISQVIANQLPGNGSVYLYQDMKFKKPVYFGEEIVCEVEVIEIIPEKSHIKLKTTCYKEGNVIVIEGVALVKHLN